MSGSVFLFLNFTSAAEVAVYEIAELAVGNWNFYLKLIRLKTTI